jgi:hypothetical protein
MFRRPWASPVVDPRRAPRPAPPPPPRPLPAPPGPHDDAAHPDEFKDHLQREWYLEWWYFNVRDEATGFSLLASYAILPFDLDCGNFEAMVFQKGQSPIKVSEVHWPAVYSREVANVTLGENKVVSAGPDRYQITARSKDGRLAWDLTLERVAGAAPAWLLSDARGPLGWEVGWWLAFMPLARASGTVTIDGVTHTLKDAVAYHDHNWGVWYTPARNWQWLQCSSLAEGVSLDLGYSDGFDPARVAILVLDGNPTLFAASGIDLPTYSGFRNWEDKPWKYPERATVALTTGDGRTRLEVEWAALEGETLPFDGSQFIVFEQHVKVTLRLLKKGAGGSFELGRTFELGGIAEWSDSTLAEWATDEGMIGGYTAEAVVFGGGVSGLTVAHELVDRGFVVSVVEPEVALDAKGERTMALGGMARSQYARVPRTGATPVDRPAGRPTPDATNDRWTSRRVAFTLDSRAISEAGAAAIAAAARAFNETYVEQGYRLRVIGSAANVEQEPRGLGARRAEDVRDRLVKEGVALDCILVAEDPAAQRPQAIVALEDYVLPGEHGFRFFPSYYRHVTDTMRRIPVYDQDGQMTHRRVLDNLTPIAGTGPATTLHGAGTPLAALRAALGALIGGDYDPRDFVQMGLRISRYLATCPERRKKLEDIPWWAYLSGYCATTQCYLYRYSDAFSRDATMSGRVLAAFDWREGDARTNGSTFMQLFTPIPDASPSRFDGALNGATTEAWLVHWRRFLAERGVRFVSGSLETLEHAEIDRDEGVIASYRPAGRTAAEPWRWRTHGPHYVVVATDAPAAERASKPLFPYRVGVPRGLDGYTTHFDGHSRDPYTEAGRKAWDRFQSLSGAQYYLDQDFAITGGRTYSKTAPWALSAMNQQRLWARIPFQRKDGFAGLVSVDIGDFNALAGPSQESAFESSRERFGEQVWMQMTAELQTAPLGPNPVRVPRPRWFHIDDNLEFGKRADGKEVLLRNATPYLVPIWKDWKNRPGSEPFDPSVPAAAVPPFKDHGPGVWIAPHGGYPVHWGSLVYAGIYLRTFTRMTTMESANESGRHAVNAILDHYNAHHGSTIAPPSPPPDVHPDPFSLEADEVPAPWVGDHCEIWNIERYEDSSFDTLKAVDQIMVDLGLPHIFDLLGVELVPSIMSHLFPYRGDCSPIGMPAPKPIPAPAKWCPPFVGEAVGRGFGKVRAMFKKDRPPR